MNPSPISPAPHSLGELLFSSTGRINRVTFVLTGAAILAVAVAFKRLDGTLAYGLTAWALYAAVLFSAACVIGKRMHDRGRSGWWTAVVIWAAVVVWPMPHGIIDMLFCAVLAVAFVDLGLLPGREGFNRFGPRP